MQTCFLFYGPEQSDSWQYLKTAGWLIDENKDAEQQIIEFLDSVDADMIRSKKQAATLRSKEIENDVQRAYDGLSQFLKTYKN